MFAILAVAIVLIVAVGNRATTQYVALAVLGSLAWLGSVLFVMGYQNVDIKGSSGSGSTGASSG